MTTTVRALLTTVETSPRECGQAFSTWACADLASYLEHKGYPPVSDETVRRHLQALGYRVIRPVLTISSPDPDYEARRPNCIGIKTRPAEAK